MSNLVPEELPKFSGIFLKTLAKSLRATAFWSFLHVLDAQMTQTWMQVSPPDLDSPLHVAVAEHRTTGVLRQLATFHKPAGKSSLERLRTLVRWACLGFL